MSIDWNALVLEPVMAVFGEGEANAPSTWPTYRPASGGAFQLRHAVFDAEYQQVGLPADEPGVSTTRPVLGVRAALFQVPPDQGDIVYIPSVRTTFAVADVQPDGHGHILLILMEAA